MYLFRPVTIILALLLFLTSCSTAPQPAPKPASGSLDTSFNTDGLAVVGFEPNVTASLSPQYHSGGPAEAVALSPDGKIVAAGRSGSDVALVRYNRDGTLDPTFDVDGMVVAPVGSWQGAEDMLVGADGTIWVAATFSNGSNLDFGVMRFHADGSLDATFGSNGVAVFDFGHYDYVRDLAVAADGKLVVTGQAYDLNTSRTAFGVARFNADGSADTSFDGDGGALVDVVVGQYDYAEAVAVDAGGKIVLAGHTYGGNSWDFTLVRLDPDGSLDPSFDTDGIATAHFGGDSYPRALTIATDGRLLVAGRAYHSDYHINEFAVARFNADGSLDAGFGDGGTVVVGYPHEIVRADGHANAVALDADGRIILVGSMGRSEVHRFAMTDDIESSTITAVRLDADGALDTSFGEGGVAMHVISTREHGDQANAVVIDADGKIVLAGEAADQFALMRLHP